MSLQVWLPLTKDLRNIGVSDLEFSYINEDEDKTSIVNNNKFTKACYNNATSGGGILSDKKINLGKNQSMFCWINSTIFHSGGDGVLSNVINAANNYNNMGLIFSRITDTTANICAYRTSMTTNSKSYNAHKSTTVLNANQWYHVGYTYDGTTVKIYINGVLDKSYTYTDQTFAEARISIIAPSFQTDGETPNTTYEDIGYINDVRIYDHTLTAREVKLISRALVAHFPLNETSCNGTIAYDTSGFNNNGTIKTAPTFNTTGKNPRYNNAMVFNGSQFVALGRSAMVKDEITVCGWVYCDPFSSAYGRLASCTEGGGWNFEITSGKIRFPVGTGTTSNTYLTANAHQTTLSAMGTEWHFIAGTYDGFSAKMYIDGVVGTAVATTGSETKTPIFYNANNGIFIGCEAGSNADGSSGTSAYTTGLISDFRIYATALSADDIMDLYTNSAYIDKTGILYSPEFIEYDYVEGTMSTIATGIKKKETSSALFTELYTYAGNTYMKILSHDNKEGTVYFTSSNCMKCNEPNLYSRLYLLESLDSLFNIDGKYEFLSVAPIEYPGIVFRWTQTNNPYTTTAVTGFVSLENSVYAGICKRTSNNACLAQTSTGNWWMAFGVYVAYQGGLPGIRGNGGSAIIKNLEELYVRIDETKLRMFKNEIQANQIYEL